MTHIFVNKLGHQFPDNGLSPFWCQAIVWISGDLLGVGCWETNSCYIWFEIQCYFLKISAANIGHINVDYLDYYGPRFSFDHLWLLWCLNSMLIGYFPELDYSRGFQIYLATPWLMFDKASCHRIRQEIFSQVSPTHCGCSNKCIYIYIYIHI